MRPNMFIIKRITQQIRTYSTSSDYIKGKNALTFQFQHWFKSGHDVLVSHVFSILSSSHSQEQADLQLSQLQLPLTEIFALRVLKNVQIDTTNNAKGKNQKGSKTEKGKNGKSKNEKGGNGNIDVKSDQVYTCLKFFDWAEQNGFKHTRITYNAIFKICVKAKLNTLLLDFLETYKSQQHLHSVRYYDTLIMGYAMAGKTHVALQLWGKMRFIGVDLGRYAYNVFLNAVLEEKKFDVFDAVLKETEKRKFDSEFTACFRVKRFCMEKRVDEGLSYVRGLMENGGKVNDYAIGVLVDELCRGNRSVEAAKLLVDFQDLRGDVSLSHAYDIWIRERGRAGEVDEALEFLRTKKFFESYVPHVYRYNELIYKLLKEERLNEVRDLLAQMQHENVAPDKLTMTSSLCYLCKAGCVDVALDLYKSRSEFGLSLQSLAYNNLVRALCHDGNVEEAFVVFKDSIIQGYVPPKASFEILADALRRENSLDKMKDLVYLTKEHKADQLDNICAKYISAVCNAGRVEEGYLAHTLMSRNTNVKPFLDLIYNCKKHYRGDLASELLIEMQENGFKPSRKMYRSIICCICKMSNPETRFRELLEKQLTRQGSDLEVIYGFFIDGAGHAGRPEFAEVVYDMIGKNRLKPSVASQLYMLQSYLKNGRVPEAFKFYDSLCIEKYPEVKLHNSMVVGLCTAEKPDDALRVLRDVKAKGLKLSLKCYEQLLISFCSVKNFDIAVEVLEELINSGRFISSFIGNVLMTHALHKDEKLYQAWVNSRIERREPFLSQKLKIGEIIKVFSGRKRVISTLETADSIIEILFPPDNFTYNTLIKTACDYRSVDCAIEIFHRMKVKGRQPDSLSYDNIIYCLCKHNRINEAVVWHLEMHWKGFKLSSETEEIFNHVSKQGKLLRQ